MNKVPTLVTKSFLPKMAAALNLRRSGSPSWMLLLGLTVLTVPTIAWVAMVSWSEEQGAHGPIVLATGVWLLVKEGKDARPIGATGSTLTTWILLVPALFAYWVTMVTGIIEIAGLTMYASVVVVLYAVTGSAFLKVLWFPLIYLIFMFPPPDQLVVALTQPLKAVISQLAVTSLYQAGYPVAQTGVMIYIAQYELLVAAACAGLNSILSLSAIGLFYIFVRHRSSWRYAACLMLAIVPAALLANFVRVLVLVLLTYHMGESTAQGFLHNFAGVLMFSLALGFVFLVDGLMGPWRERLAGGADARPS